MASKKNTSIVLFLVLNLVFFTLSSACVNCPTPNTKPNPGFGKGYCPIDTLKLGVCANLLGGLIGVIIETLLKAPCCSLIQGMVDLEAAACLCTAIKVNILGIKLNVPLSLSLLLNTCSKNVPKGFVCA